MCFVIAWAFTFDAKKANVGSAIFEHRIFVSEFGMAIFVPGHLKGFDGAQTLVETANVLCRLHHLKIRRWSPLYLALIELRTSIIAPLIELELGIIELELGLQDSMIELELGHKGIDRTSTKD